MSPAFLHAAFQRADIDAVVGGLGSRRNRHQRGGCEAGFQKRLNAHHLCSLRCFVCALATAAFAGPFREHAAARDLVMSRRNTGTAIPHSQFMLSSLHG
jgi:hypothetical protein